ncbi:MAG: hypothetical protein WEA10_08035 [Actinomycetota bacterium]
MRRPGRRAALATAVIALLAIIPALPASSVSVAQSVIVSDDPSNDTPHVLDGKVLSVAHVGNWIVLGGKFTEARNAGTSTIHQRKNLLAFNATTGQLSTSFAPTVNNDVNVVLPAADGTSVYVGGKFSTYNGTAVKKLIKVDATTGDLDTGFKPKPLSAVKDLVLRGDRLYLAGDFKKVKGQDRIGLAAVDPLTGAVDPDVNIPFTEPRNGSSPSVNKIDVTPNGTRLIAIGNFKKAAGQTREQIAMLDVGSTPATLANWQTSRFAASNCSNSFDTYMRDVDISPDGSYFVVVTTGAYSGGPPTLCDTASRWETAATGTDLQPTWVNYTGGDTLYSVAVTGTAVYVGGHQRWQNNPYNGDSKGPGAVDRSGLAALDPANGVPFTWNPGRGRGVGVFSILATSDGIYIGNDTEKLGGEFHARIGMFPTAGGTTPPVTVPGAIPGDFYRVETSGNFQKRTYDGTTFGSPQSAGGSLSTLRGAMMLSGKLYHGASDGKFYVRSFNGSSLGSATQIPTLGLESKGFAPQNLTGMFYDNARIYYTISGRTGLFYRYFTPESNILGAEEFTATTGGGVDWKNVKGMTMASGRLYVVVQSGSGGNVTGRLYRVNWVNGLPSGSLTQIGGQGVDSVDWRSLGLFVLAP